MTGPTYPKYVDEGLKGIDASFHIRWNPNARVTKPGGFSPDGEPIPPQYEPRYEVWGVDADGAEYRLMLCDINGEFVLPGDWLITHLNRINPANFGGNIRRMLDEMVDSPNNVLQSVHERDWQDFVQGVASWYWNIGKTMVTRTKDGF